MDQFQIPESFAQFSASQITQILAKFISKRKKKTSYISPKSSYGQAVQQLLDRESTLQERKFLYDLWNYTENV